MPSTCVPFDNFADGLCKIFEVQFSADLPSSSKQERKVKTKLKISLTARKISETGDHTMISALFIEQQHKRM